jgi:hypothetical protein
MRTAVAGFCHRTSKTRVSALNNALRGQFLPRRQSKEDDMASGHERQTTAFYATLHVAERLRATGFRTGSARHADNGAIIDREPVDYSEVTPVGL